MVGMVGQECMSRLIIIGNGFNLAYGLNIRCCGFLPNYFSVAFNTFDENYIKVGSSLLIICF